MLSLIDYKEFIYNLLDKYNFIISTIEPKENKDFVENRNDYSLVINGRINFIDNSFLDVREYIVFEDQKLFTKKYAYQYQKDEIIKIFRYDNVPHWPNIKTFPEHKHNFLSKSDEPGILEESYNISLSKVFKEISTIISL